MSERYKVTDHQGIHFITFSVVDWIDVFTRKEYTLALLESIRYCQQHKGLILYAYVIMPSHIHMLVSATEGQNLSDIIRDLKKYTSQHIIKLIHDIPESRRDWMLYRFSFAGKNLQRVKNYKFWQDGFHAKLCETNEFLQQKLDYIHNNPVEAMLAYEPEGWPFSSAANYTGEQGMLDVVLIE